MLITLVIILLLIWSAVVWSIYSNFLVFYSNFNESENYHKAYYNSISALERAELVTRQREPWYVWSGWVIKWAKGWSNQDSINTDWDLNWFSYLWEHPERSAVFWTINSKTDRIPALWDWDVEVLFSTWDTNDYNMMDYEDTQVFILYYDKSDWSPYQKISCTSWTDCQQSYPDAISWTIRLPIYLTDKPAFEDGLNVNDELVRNWPNNDAIVDRQLKWKYNGSAFTIYATQKYNMKNIEENRDNAFRESDINAILNFNFWARKYSPLPSSSRWGWITEHTVISPMETAIKKIEFHDIISDSSFTSKELRFSLLNLLKSPQNAIFPFLEYYVEFWTDVSDKYFTINAQWDYNDYQINKILWKPTKKESVLWSFTSIF